MKRWLCRLLAAIYVIFSGEAVNATKPSSHFRPIVAGELFQQKADRAYILARCMAAWEPCAIPMFLRLPSADEVNYFQSAKLEAWKKKGGKIALADFSFELPDINNLYYVDTKNALERDAVGSTYLIETDPGTYVIYGLGNKLSMAVCLCLGSIKFSAKAGDITDVGTFLSSRASEPPLYPELAEVTDLGPTFDMDFPLPAIALRPVSANDRLPSMLRAFPRVAAQFHAVGPFFEASARLITRLAPFPGVLAYKRGAVIDVRSGEELPSR
ncbi:MAG: hypothetical protein V4618_08055 [Pseudomonadota bacterium]